MTRKSRKLSEVRPIPRRGLSRDEAAMYIGISVTKFDVSMKEMWDVAIQVELSPA